jgi:cell division protein FtsB
MNVAIRLLHAAFAIALVGWLVASYAERRSELIKVRDAAASERLETQRLQNDIERGKALRDGLKRDDPYVIEYLARERLQYTGPGEMNPPPR